jgi:hypothetical protein
VNAGRTTGLAPIPVPRPQLATVFNKKVVITMPWQKQISPITGFCVSQLMDSRKTASMLHYGDAFVTHSRNSCADAFLASDLEWMLTIDDDMIVPFGNAKWFKMHTGFSFPEKFLSYNALDRLMSHGKTLVGALYFGRNHFGSPMYGEGMDPAEAAFARKAPCDIVKPTRWVGTGCMLIHRSVYEDIEKAFPRLARNGKDGGQWFTSTEARLVQQVTALRDTLQGQRLTGEHAMRALNGLEAIISQAAYDNPLGTGEDVSFCLRARTAGHKPHVDMGLVCGHVGTCVFGPGNTYPKK